MSDDDIRVLADCAVRLSAADPNAFLPYDSENWRLVLEVARRDNCIFESEISIGLGSRPSANSAGYKQFSAALEALGIEIRSNSLPERLDVPPIQMGVLHPPEVCTLSLSFVCHRDWIDLKPLPMSSDRFCTSCSKTVRRCTTVAELEDAQQKQQCVSFAVGLI
jgi:hypothetical protein